MLRSLILAVIHAYRFAIRPILAPACRFHPSCSEYALQSVEQLGALRGSLRALGRVFRCHPWHPGGYDPVTAEAPGEGPGRAPGPSA
jgi:putative membrane protein insertion efficiency factor